jgi:hypothetical protein
MTGKAQSLENLIHHLPECNRLLIAGLVGSSGLRTMSQSPRPASGTRIHRRSVTKPTGAIVVINAMISQSVPECLSPASGQ